MSEIKPLNIDVISKVKPVDEAKVDQLLKEELSKLNKKVIALDDDPTGVQTVNNVSVYTDWAVPTLEQGFNEDKGIFFVLTNSRGLTVEQTTKAHHQIAENIVAASKNTGKDFIIISRSDSTLRGHYPLETSILRADIEKLTGKKNRRRNNPSFL